ncbi:AbrB/MazE/SpoVT family DNA-binding domain-containing protein [Paraburkholderia phenazinium]|jgi:antitoxin MazE|uniref:Antitoxin MazE n=1 Tax=Paraburkholderia phenazinium TaxID=60549 RepID=A0A1G8DQQ2_9BURK|nr:antitoxin MazE [Paraburkholderia phenazinium]
MCKKANIREDSRKLKIEKWGNSLALRIPDLYLRHLGIQQGDQVRVNLTVDGGIHIRAAAWNRRAFARELEETRRSLPMTISVIEELRRPARR